MGAGGTGSRKGCIRPFGTELDGYHSGRHVADHHGNEKGAYPSRPPAVKFKAGIFKNGKPPQPAAGNNANSIGVGAIDLEP